MEPCLLALDTSTEQMALAVLAPSGAHCHVEPGGAVASARLLPAALALLAEAGIAPAALDAIAFGRGPGAFTGLRTACAVAQGLAFGLGRPVLAIDSLEIVAQQADAAEGELLWVALDARMDEIYAAAYCREAKAGREAAAWRVIEPPRLYTLEALAQVWRDAPPRAITGSAIAAFGERLPIGAARRVEPHQDRAAALLDLAHAAWLRRELLAPDDALPLYLRDKVALTSAERAAVASS